MGRRTDDRNDRLLGTGHKQVFPLFWSDERLWNWDLEIRDVDRALRYEVNEIGRVISVGDTVVLQTLKHGLKIHLLTRYTRAGSGSLTAGPVQTDVLSYRTINYT